MSDRWRDDAEFWRSRGGRDWVPGHGYHPQPRDYPRYGFGPDDGRYYGEPYGWPAGVPYGTLPWGYGFGYGIGGDFGGRHRPRRGFEAHHGRDFLDRAGDEVASWFGDDEAAERREADRHRGHSGKGPRGYRRSDERIAEDVNDRLTDDRHLDASTIEVSVSDGEVTLIGTVDSRADKRRAEDLAESVSGVHDVHNTIRVNRGSQDSATADAGRSKQDSPPAARH